MAKRKIPSDGPGSSTDPVSSREERGEGLRFGLFLLLLAVGAFLAFTPRVRAFLALENLRGLVSTWGGWAFAGYLVCAVLLPFLWTPRSVLIVLAGVLFGRGPGALMAWIGSLLSAAAGFLVARHLARRAVGRWLRRRGIRTDGVTERELWSLVFLARLCPVAHAELTCYLAGMSRMSIGAFVALSALGYVPNTLAWAFLGDSFTDANSTGFAPWVLAYLGLATLLTLGAMGRAMAKVRGASKAEPLTG